MEYAIETLEIELNKWKDIYRQHEKYMYQDPNEFSGKALDEAEKRRNEISMAIIKLKS